MYDTVDFALVHRSHGYHQAAVAHRRSYVGVEIAFFHGVAYHSTHGRVYAAGASRHGTPYLGKLGRSVILNLAVAVYNTVDSRSYRREGEEVAGQSVESRIERGDASAFLVDGARLGKE